MSLLRNLALVQRLGTSTVEARSSLEERGRAHSHRGGPAWAEGVVMGDGLGLDAWWDEPEYKRCSKVRLRSLRAPAIVPAHPIPSRQEAADGLAGIQERAG
jgi:hypothetical protein